MRLTRSQRGLPVEEQLGRSRRQDKAGTETRDSGTSVSCPAGEGAIVERGNRVFVALRKQGRFVRGKPVFHAVTPYCRIALCCAEPGSSSEWAEPPAATVTCPICLRRLEKL